ncbi:GNAT family N-acetyltransferase [Caenimonas sp. SL110]|uniref:GNAT family N-acetyltransferase n=1 Tax=Caenimonas sp. SL110 TaxID=1450524 RepID=UPI000652BBB1|nr:GNAT family N-acetyltransferase [Caenimonas sp. SL110]
MPLHFRPALPSDITACHAMRGQTRENAVSAQRLDAMGITVQAWSSSVRAGQLAGHVCTEHDRVVGYCFGDTQSGEVIVLALLPDCERRGAGKHLLDLVVNGLIAAGHRRLFLGCSADPATRSYGFYRHLGWTSTGAFDEAGDEVLEFIAR